MPCTLPFLFFVWTEKKDPKQVKISGLGIYLGTPLARFKPGRVFVDLPLVAQHGPSGGVKNVIMYFW